MRLRPTAIAHATDVAHRDPILAQGTEGSHQRRRQPRKRSLSAAWTAAPFASLPYPLVQIRQSESVRSL